MGHLIDPCSFLGLALDPDIDEPLGEYAATGQVLMILPERFKCFVKGLGQTVDLCLLLVGKIEEIEVIGPQPHADGSISLMTPSRPAIRMAAYA